MNIFSLASLLFFLLFSFSSLTYSEEDRQLIMGKIEMIPKFDREAVIEMANKISGLEGMQSVWVRKMGPSSWGVSFFRKHGGTKTTSEASKNEIVKILGKENLANWDISSPIFWIKKGI